MPNSTITINIGRFLFENRGFTPIPFWIAILIASFTTNAEHSHLFNSIVGVILVIVGEAIRMACVKYARSITRTRNMKTGNRLIKEGLFRYSRNPIYVGNFLIGAGITFQSCVIVALPVYIVLYVLQYFPIVAFEEALLENKFGSEYLDYKNRVHRWIGYKKSPPVNVKDSDCEIFIFRRVLKSESSTLIALVVLSIVMQIHYFI